MAETTVVDFLTSLRDQIEQATLHEKRCFTAVVPHLEAVTIERLSRYPAVLIMDMGGVRNSEAQLFDNRRVAITIVDSVPRDRLGEESALEVLRRGADLLNLLHGDTTYSLWLIQDSETGVMSSEDGMKTFVYRTWTFEYALLIDDAAADDDIFAVESDLVIPSSSYTTGGTLVGEKLTAAIVGFAADDELNQRHDTGAQYQHIRSHGYNATLAVSLARRTSTVLGLMFGGLASGETVTGVPSSSHKPGHILPESEYTKLLLRPKDGTRNAFFYMPRARVLEVGSAVWATGIPQMSASSLMILGTVNPDVGITQPFYWGDPASFPSLA